MATDFDFSLLIFKKYFFRSDESVEQAKLSQRQTNTNTKGKIGEEKKTLFQIKLLLCRKGFVL